MRFVMLIKNSVLFVLVVCDLVLNSFLIHFLLIKSRQQKRLPVTPKKYLKKYEEMFVKPILKLILNSILILCLNAIPHFLLSFYRIKSVSQFTEYPLQDKYSKYVNSSFRIYLILSNLFFVLNILQRVVINIKLAHGFDHRFLLI
ncbi:hypothetical protein BpHYR1_033990 [Brachionus plicatilis]|uniref:Uncharacterized protein n=1 Tax=Brachionus plicatilis TaxID=10195 RepID=A0A3M7R4G0_BRAPC|nr:hypothetical protein BpHYR1_033990 [Brachionus plicatilis]